MAGDDDFDEKDRGAYFSFLVRKAISRNERHNNTTVAKGVGMPYQAFYNRIQGSTPFSADEIRRLIAVLPDASLASYLLLETPYVAAERIDTDRVHEADAMYQAAHRVMFEASDVLREVDMALEDNRIDHRDAASIVEQIEDAERSLISLREYLSRNR